jgi:hypothetical protein
VYDFLPSGIVSRLIVRNHSYLRTPEDGWSSGALFTDGPNHALVRTLASGTEIELRARGPQRKELLSAIAKDLDRLNNTYGNLKSANHVEVWVPCICDTCAVQVDDVHLFSRESLRRKLSKQGTESTDECDKSLTDVSVLNLLDGVDLDDRDEDRPESAITVVLPPNETPPEKASEGGWTKTQTILTGVGILVAIAIALGLISRPPTNESDSSIPASPDARQEAEEAPDE